MYNLKALTFGCELEILVPNNRVTRFKTICENANATVGTDGSIKTETDFKAYEVRSKIYHFGEQKDLASLVAKLHSIGVKVNNSCGGHIHIGVKPYTDKMTLIQRMEFVNRSYHNFYNIENALYAVNGGEKRKTGGYAGTVKPIVDKLSASEFLPVYPTSTGQRYYGFNICSYLKYGTFEFRVFEGSVDPLVWIANIDLASRFIWKTANKHEFPELEASQWQELGTLFNIDPKVLKEYRVIFRTKETANKIKALKDVKRLYSANHVKVWKTIVAALNEGIPDLDIKERAYLQLRALFSKAQDIVVMSNIVYMQVGNQAWYIEISYYQIHARNSSTSRDEITYSFVNRNHHDEFRI